MQEKSLRFRIVRQCEFLAAFLFLAVALANKLARIAWSVLAGQRRYQARRTNA